MKSISGNPKSNIIGPGVTEPLVEKAIRTSGYPLQLIVANTLRREFSIIEEWGYTDPEINSVRTIDILASKDLYEISEKPKTRTRVHPSLVFIIECKQSDLPYIFFLSEGTSANPEFPLICGLKCSEICISTDVASTLYRMSPFLLFKLGLHPFLTMTSRICSTFSKCVRKGKELELSGSEAYYNLIFPISKAVQHYQNITLPKSKRLVYTCDLTIGLGVLDAPMIGIRVTDSGIEMEPIPWVRVLRHQPYESEIPWEHSRTYAIDIVHKDYLKTYVQKYVLPFSLDFSRLALKHSSVLINSKGFAPGIYDDLEYFPDFESVLKASVPRRRK